MYITKTTENVINLFDKIDELEDDSKLKIFIYSLERLNNNQINNKNEINPDLLEDEDLRIFNMESLGFQANFCTILLQYLVMVHNQITQTKEVYADNGSIIGLKYDENETIIISDFEKLSFNEKLDVFSELFIRYDNETYFENKITMLSFDSNKTGFDIAKQIQNMKEV